MPGVALLLFLHFWGAAEKQRFEARVAELKAKGQPVRCEDLAGTPVPDAENAATLFAEAARILKEREESGVPRLWGLEEETEEEREQAHAYLESLGPYFEKLAEVPKRTGWYVAREWQKWPDVRYDEIMWLSNAAGYLACRAELDPEERGRTRRAAEAAVLMIDLGERCRMPGVLGYLVVQTATVYHPVWLLRTASRQPRFDAAEFRRIVEKRLVAPDAGALRAAIAQERVTAIWAVELRRAGGKSPLDDYLPMKGALCKSPTLRFLLYRDGSRALDLLDEAMAAANKGPEEALRAAERLRAECPTRISELQPVSGPTAGILPRLIEKEVDLVAIERLAHVVMALLEYRQREGKWPESLAILGEMPLDPFSGLPFAYEVTDSGARIHAEKQLRDPTTGKRRGACEEWEALEEDFLAWTFKD